MATGNDSVQSYLRTTILPTHYLNHHWIVDMSKLIDKPEVFSTPFKPQNREEWFLALRRPEDPTDDLKLLVVIREKLKYKIKLNLRITVYEFKTKREMKKMGCIFDLVSRNGIKTGIRLKFSPPKLDFKLDFYFSDKQCIAERLYIIDRPSKLQIGHLTKAMLTMFEDGIATDVTFKVRGTTMKAHSFIIANRCDFLHKLIQSEAVNGVLYLNFVEPTEFKLFLRYLYTNSIENESSDVVKALYSCGCMFLMPALTRSCKNRLISEMTPWNAASVYNLADSHNDKDFSEVVFDFIGCNLNVVSNTEEWIALPDNLFSNS